MGGLQITWFEYPSVTVVDIIGQIKPGKDLDETTEKLEEALSRGRVEFVVNFNKTWVNSLGLGWLYMWNNKIESAGGVLVVCGVKQPTCNPVKPKLPFALVPGLKEAASKLGIPEWSLRERS